MGEVDNFPSIILNAGRIGPQGRRASEGLSFACASALWATLDRVP